MASRSVCIHVSHAACSAFHDGLQIPSHLKQSPDLDHQVHVLEGVGERERERERKGGGGGGFDHGKLCTGSASHLVAWQSIDHAITSSIFDWPSNF